MALLWTLLGALLLLLVMMAGALYVARKWVYESVELEEGGISTTGVVIAKVEHRRSRYIRYEYMDQFGKKHRRKVLVLPEAWTSLHEGGPIDVVYSAKRPHVSAPKYLLGLVRDRKERGR